MSKHTGQNALTFLLTLLNTKFGTKVDKVEGMGLSTNDYTTAEKTKLSGIAANADVSPTISTDITADATSDTKTASPKAVKSYVDGKMSSTYKPAGSATISTLPTLSASVEGFVYNMTAAFTTTADFVEGAGSSYPSGTNVVVINAGSNTYKFDVLAGFVDLSDYVKSDDIVELTNTEIQTIWNEVFTEE